MYSKIPILRPPLKLPRSGPASGVFLIMDIKYMESLILDWQMGFLIAEWSLYWVLLLVEFYSVLFYGAVSPSAPLLPNKHTHIHTFFFGAFLNFLTIKLGTNNDHH